MSNIKELLKKERTSLDLINESYEKTNRSRTRLGLSQAGNKCLRFLWYCHNGYIGDSPDGRVLRLFQLGNIIEDQVIDDLKKAGFNVHGHQKPVKIEYNGITLTGSIDGIVEGLIEAPKTKHLFECKSASKKKYEELIKKGSYEKFNPVYYWQVQFYMIGLGLKRAAVFVYCKDDSRLYIERICLDVESTIGKLQDIFAAIGNTNPPQRVCSDVNWYEAKWCPFFKECFCL